MKKPTEKKDVLEPLKLDFTDLFLYTGEESEDNNPDKNRPKIVYFSDFAELTLEKLSEAMHEIQAYQHLCHCTPDEEDCKCFKTKFDRDNGNTYGYLYSGTITEKAACEVLLRITEEIIESIHARSFYCECDLTLAKERDARYKEYLKENGMDGKHDPSKIKKNNKELSEYIRSLRK